MDKDNIIDEIIDLDGDCLSSVRCQSCPFKKNCLLEFLRDKPHKLKRKRIALNNAFRISVMDEDEYIWET